MTEFDKIILSNIYSLFKISIRLQNKNIHYVKQEYSRTNQHFEPTIEFLKVLKFLKYSDDIIVLSKTTNNFVENGTVKLNKLKLELVKLLIQRKNRFNKAVTQYLALFSDLNGELVHIPTLDERIVYSNIRNFLIEIEFIMHNINENYYYISKRYLNEANKIISISKKLTPKRLKSIIDNKELIGYNAELEIVIFEKKRLSKHPYLMRKILHIANEDVLAGYDILSWEQLNKDGEEIPRYIEVKAVPKNEICFYWSRNEIRKAEELADRYYLYLLPVIGKNDFDISKLIVIQNPFINVFNKSNVWKKQVEMFLFTQVSK